MTHEQLADLAAYRTGTPAVERLAKTLGRQERARQRWQLVKGLLRSRLLSGAVAVGYLMAAVAITRDLNSVIRVLSFIALPLVCIWFADSMGRLTGVRFGLVRPTVTQSTPGTMVALGGWILLLTPAIVWLVA